MQRKLFKILSFVLLICVICSSNVYSQKKKVAPKKNSGSTGNPFGGGTPTPTKPVGGNPFGGGTPNTTQPPVNTGGGNPFGGSPAAGTGQSTSGNADPFAPKPGATPSVQPPAGGNFTYDPKIPIVVVKTASGGDPLNDSLRPSLRNESAIISNGKDRTPLEYDFIREDDAIYRQRIWEVIDAREKINQPFKYDAVEDNGNQLFFAILYKAITEDSVMAFEDERFTMPYKDVNKFKSKFSGGIDTAPVFDLDGSTILRYEVRTKEYPVDSIYKFQIKEEVIFDKEASKLVRRIVGIAPMGPLIVKGKVYDGPHFPLFWIYYPDVRKVLAKKQVFNAKNLGARQTWEDYLENHMFSYYIIKSSLDNIRNQNLDLYVKDPLFRLLEGEKIKTQIFNYEQGLWAY